MEPEPSHSPGHETTDAEIRPIVWLGVLLTLVVLAISGLLWWLMSHWLVESDRSQPVISPLAADQADPPGPLLEPSATSSLAAYREQQDQKLSSYGWIDKPKVVRIPIERAMELALERGLPTPVQSEAGGAATPQDQDLKRADEQPETESAAKPAE